MNLSRSVFRNITRHPQWAGRVTDEYPRTAAMLGRIAGNDEDWARRQDDQSSHFLDGE
jgi:hypothetical protein